MALSRAVESLRSGSSRVCDDYLARHFLGRRYGLLIRYAATRRLTEWALGRLLWGHHGYVLARTRYIDEWLLRGVDERVDQVVILGAGFDSRAHRFSKQLQGLAVFEVDHPATQSLKRQKIGRTGDMSRSNVVYAPVDFAHDELEQALVSKGFDVNGRTLFIWEGTTPYLEPQALDNTLAFIKHRSATGSQVVFDYVLESVVRQTCDIPGARREFLYMSRTSEPLTLGIDPSRIQVFLAKRGFTDVHDVGSEELVLPFQEIGHRRTRIKSWWRIVRARTGGARPADAGAS